jgi:hypothetical protein
MAFYSSENGFLSPCCIGIALSESISSLQIPSQPFTLLDVVVVVRLLAAAASTQINFLFQPRAKWSNAPRNLKFKSNSRFEFFIATRRLPPNGQSKALSLMGRCDEGCASAQPTPQPQRE